MKTKHLKSVISATAGLALIVTTMTASAQTQTTDTRIGKLSFENGFPSEETTRKVFDELDYQRAVQAYLWAYPAVSFESIRLGSAPAGLEANWIETVPDKGYYPMFRIYYPKAGLFDGTWKLPDVELMK